MRTIHRSGRSARLPILLLVLVVSAGLAAFPVVPARAAASDPVVVSVEGGTCALLDDESVVCWGSNWSGALGNGTPYSSVIPQPVDLPGPATEISTGASFGCALMSADGSAWCWGRNDSGELGLGKATDAVLTPVPVPGLDHLVAISSGAMHTCAVRDDGSAWCWGNGGNGQAGPAWTYDTAVPVQVTGITDALDVTTGSYSTCLLLAGGDVTCFGYYPRSDGDRSAVPTVVPGLHGAVALAGTCGVLADGTVRCFGWNTFGQLGDGTTTDRIDPVEAVGLHDAIDIASGGHTCVARASGAVACWGRNVEGELGLPADDPSVVLTPQTVAGISGATSVSTGGGHSCALAAGVVSCWGANNEGQLGDRTVISRSTPAPISWVADTTIPVASQPDLAIRERTLVYAGGGIRTLITVPVDDGADGTGVAGVELRVRHTATAAWGPVKWKDTSWRPRLFNGETYYYRVRPVDRVGNVGAWVESPRIRAKLLQETASVVQYKGDWRTTRKHDYLGHSIAYTKQKGASATFTVKARSIGIASRVASNRGAFRVYVDGVDEGIVDQHWSDMHRILIWSWSWPTTGEHTIRMVSLGSEGHPRIDLDAIAVLR